MTCKDCVHDEACEKLNRLVQIDAHTWDEYGLLDDVEKFCGKFKNKADFVEVVRCKNCKQGHYCQEPCHGKLIYYCDRTGLQVNKYSFCSYGERRDS